MNVETFIVVGNINDDLALKENKELKTMAIMMSTRSIKLVELMDVQTHGFF